MGQRVDIFLGEDQYCVPRFYTLVPIEDTSLTVIVFGGWVTVWPHNQAPISRQR
jgi:hypothetical protein